MYLRSAIYSVQTYLALFTLVIIIVVLFFQFLYTCPDTFIYLYLKVTGLARLYVWPFLFPLLSLPFPPRFLGWMCLELIWILSASLGFWILMYCFDFLSTLLWLRTGIMVLCFCTLIFLAKQIINVIGYFKLMM